MNLSTGLGPPGGSAQNFIIFKNLEKIWFGPILVWSFLEVKLL